MKQLRFVWCATLCLLAGLAGCEQPGVLSGPGTFLAEGGGPASNDGPGTPSWSPDGVTLFPEQDSGAPAPQHDAGSVTPQPDAAAPAKPDVGAPKPPPPIGGPCDSVPKAVAPSAGDAPSVYGGAWTAAPTEGCSFVDGEGRTVNLTATQHRMIYRVNEVRALQTAVDGVQRPMLEADFCLQEFSQGYLDAGNSGHSQMNLTMYPIPGGGMGSGGNFIGENYGMHGGYTSDPMAATDRLINGWWNSGSTTTGHRGNMLKPRWTKGGMGVVVKGSTAIGIQTFSRKYANWLWGWSPCTDPPKVNDPMSTIPNPL